MTKNLYRASKVPCKRVSVPLQVLRSISTQENFPRTENFPKISLLKVENSTSKFFSDGKFVSANHILQIFLSAENFPEWK